MKTLLSILLLTYAVPSFGQWSGNPATNTPICIAPDIQDLPQLVSDGIGGAIITWLDWRNGPGDIYAQRIGANGFVQWTTDGISVCSNAITQNRPMMVSDGTGGAIIVWEDLRNGGGVNDIYAQRINSSGVAQWVSNGIPVCTAVGAQSRPMIATDGAGGAIITWYDQRTSGQYDNYAQRVNAGGVVQWATNGVALCPNTASQIDPKIIADGAGGAIVVWKDNRTNTQTDIYAQRINGNGVIQWSTSGLAICVLRRQQWAPSIAPDGNGGAIIAWADQRDTIAIPFTDDIYAQRVDSSGNRLWAPDGAAICTEPGDQRGPIILPDAGGGAIITWYDTRNGSSNRDIYAQRVGPFGFAVWSSGGVPICTAVNDQDWANPISDGNGGAIISWEDERAGGSNRHVYAQRVNASGAVQWAANGVAIGTAPGYKSFSQILPVATGDGIITWGDERSGSNNRNIFAQRINNNGTLTSVRLSEQIPASFSLEQNYPNPFNPTTVIQFSVGTYGHTSLRVYDILGREVRTLVNENLSAGSYSVTFNAEGLSSGVYLSRLTSGGLSLSRKLLLTK